MTEADYTIVRLDNSRRMALAIDREGKLWWLDGSTNSIEETLPEDYKLKWDIPGLTNKRSTELRKRIRPGD